MAEESYLMMLFYVIFIYFAVNESFVNGGRLQQKNRNSITHAISPTRKDLVRKTNLGENGIGIRPPLYAGKNNNFLITVSFGTPAKDFTLLFDTGSDLTWIACQPCSSNSNPKISTFDPSSSSTFSPILNNNSITNYTGNYNDHSSFTGYFVKDTLTLVSDYHPEFVFACARQINGEFEGASGLLGLGKGKFSLLAQTDSTLFSTFCYCLPAVSSTSPGYFTLGVQAFESCQPEPDKFIPIEPAPEENGLTGYYISLTGISIGGNRIDVSSVRAIIDSGTVISRLSNSLYMALRSEFQAIMSEFSRVDSPEPELFDTCYNLQKPMSDWTPPVILLHFGDVDVELDSSAATIMGKSESEICLAFAGNKDDNDVVIIGNQQHRNRDLFFDLNGKSFHFSSGRCMNI